jgi:hypothetical protein
MFRSRVKQKPTFDSHAPLLCSQEFHLSKDVAEIKTAIEHAAMLERNVSRA